MEIQKSSFRGQDNFAKLGCLLVGLLNYKFVVLTHIINNELIFILIKPIKYNALLMWYLY